jgi:hypothetical protein
MWIYSRPTFVRALITLFVCSLVAGGFPQGPRTAQAQQDSGIQTVATVTSETRVGLRDKPDADAKVVSKLDSGSVVTLLDGPKDDGWYFVKLANNADSKAGWISQGRLVFDHFAIVVADNRLREKPFDESPTLSDLVTGTVVTIAGPKVGAFVTPPSRRRPCQSANGGWMSIDRRGLSI